MNRLTSSSTFLKMSDALMSTRRTKSKKGKQKDCCQDGCKQRDCSCPKQQDCCPKQQDCCPKKQAGCQKDACQKDACQKDCCEDSCKSCDEDPCNNKKGGKGGKKGGWFG